MELIKTIDEVKEALRQLGYDLTKHTVEIREGLLFERCAVVLDGEYFGVWDVRRKTFVD